jgi:predicted lipid-binding transport protein (Tim44 family)
MKKSLLWLTIACSLAACDARQPPYQQSYAPPPVPQVAPAAPVIVNSTPAQSSGMGDMLAGGMMGYLLGKSSGGGGASVAPSSSHTVVNKTVVNKTVIVQHAPQPVAPTPAPAPVAKVEPPKPAAAPAPAPVRTNYAAAFKSAPAAPAKVSYSSAFRGRK